MAPLWFDVASYCIISVFVICCVAQVAIGVMRFNNGINNGYTALELLGGGLPTVGSPVSARRRRVSFRSEARPTYAYSNINDGGVAATAHSDRDGNERAENRRQTRSAAVVAPIAIVSAEERREARPVVGRYDIESAATFVDTSKTGTSQRVAAAAPASSPSPALAPALAPAGAAALASAAAASAAPAPAPASKSDRRRGLSSREGIYEAVREAAGELVASSGIPGVCEAATLVSVLVNLVADSRGNAEGVEPRLKQCRSIIRMLQRAARVLGKGGGDSGQTKSECEMIEDVHEAVAALVELIKNYQSRNKVSKVLVSTLFKRRQEEAEAVVDRAIWRLNLDLHVQAGQKLNEVGEDVKEGLRLQVAQASKETEVAGGIAESLAEDRRVRRQRKLHLLQIPEDHVMITNELLGKGGFGSVYIADYNGRNAAAKVMNVAHELGGAGGYDGHGNVEERKQGAYKHEKAETQRKAFFRELDAMMRLRSPHTVNVYGAMMSREDRLVLVMELLAGGDLRMFLRNSAQPLPESRVRRIMADVCAGMAFLHARDAVHGDLKSANVLLDGDGRAKIGDFGTSQWVQHTNSTNLATYATSEVRGVKMSFAWAAPEVLETQGNSYASDVYSFGIVTWEIITRELPWADEPLTRDIFLRVVMMGERPVIPDDCPLGIAEVVRACWADKPADRPTFDDIVKSMKSIG